MTTQTASLGVPSAKKFALDHRGTTNARTQRDHYHIVATSRGSRVAFAEQGHAGVVLDGKAQTQLLPTPALEIDRRCVLVFLVRRDHSANARIGEPAESKRQAFTVRGIQSKFCQQPANRLRE